MLLPLLLLLVGGELALRFAGWPKATRGSFAHNQIYWVSDPGLRSAKWAHKEENTSFLVSTDEHGLRGPVHPVEKAAGSTRILTLGCSTTFGWGVDDAATYPAQLEGVLREKGRKVEVINGGQPGYTSFQGLWLWDKVLARYQPDLVVFGYIVQDSRKVAYSDKSQAILQGNADFLKANLLYNSRLFLGTRELIDRFRIEQKEVGEVHRVSPDEYAENIRAFADRVQAVGAKLLLFGFPLEREGYTAEHRELLHAAADVLSVPVFDPQPQMEEATRSQQLYFSNDRGHANAAGCSLIATWMAAFLEKEKLLGG